MNIRAFLLLLAVVLCGTSLFADVPGFPFDPAISPDGDEVCFVFDGDLWIVPFQGGDARRLTNTPSFEWSPVWSPDGKWIAFDSQREGQTHPYLISPEGGEAKVIIREAYTLVEWFNDGKHLLVTKGGFEYGASFYKLPLDGSRATLLGEYGNRFASLSPDNTKIIFNRYGDAHREAYQGSLNGDLWMLDIPSKTYTQLTSTKLTERYPRYSYSSNSVYYCYSDGNSFQLHKAKDLNFSRSEKLSNLPFFSARDISIARANDKIVFEHFDEIYRYDPTRLSGDKIQKLAINIPEDIWQYTKVTSTLDNDMDDFNVSEDELLIAFNFKYDSFLFPRKGGQVKQLTTDHSGWSNLNFIDNRTLLLNKLHNGKDQLFTAKVDSVLSLQALEWFGKDSLTVEGIAKDENGRWQITYRDYFRSGRVAVADSGFVNLRPMNTPWVVTSNFAINKSGTHAAYCIIRDDSYMRELYIYDFATDTHRKVLTDDAWISSIFWSQDERSLLFTRNYQLYRLDLVPRDEFEYEVDNWQEIFSAETESTKADSTKSEPQDFEEDDDEEYLIDIVVSDDDDDDIAVEEEPVIIEPKKVEIAWEGIDKRMFPIVSGVNTSLYIVKIQSDSTFLYIDYPWFGFSSPTLKKADVYGKNVKEEFSFGKGSDNFKLVGYNIYYQQEGALKSCDLSGGKRKEIKAKLEYTYDTLELNKRVFEQAWGAFGDNFYDPDMHGKDWTKMYQTFRPYVDKARNIDDIAVIINEMIGDVNASHTAFYPRSEREIPSKASAYLGLELNYRDRPENGIKITRVYPNTRLSSFYKLKAGDTITHLEGVRITANTPIDSLLAGKAGKQVRFTVVSGDSITQVITKAYNYSDARELWYNFKVNRSREQVNAMSGGKLGYVHVPAMGNEDYTNFFRDVFKDNYEKEALVLDFRGNHGGRIHDQIISLLIKKTYGYSTSRRYSREKRPEPLRSIDKPTIVLVDENSFSDGEIFPIVYQELKLGKVVGYPSSGAVIGTWEYDLIDGSSMRMPGSGWYKMDGTNMEGTGAMPDIIVENHPNDVLAGYDRQLERAVHELMNDMKK